ncbi:ankyrin repeat-containing protein BDA1-like [Eucalyptus grandis]|uniref:ankyrin repeat-containing protein BDA1-like n=1 Tax=Eucalyptus grandis TaxID=71139 RepID=UPI00192EF54F|nr:ankyrin repeat-containing protein BDA1-like [Eucalyptus grandis]
MEQFLAEPAVKEGDIQALRAFIIGKADRLRELAVSYDGHTLLHTACFIGHLNLVEALLGSIPEFARKKSVDDLYPLHIAAAQGHVEIAKELVEGRKDLCLLKGPDDRIPLHYAIDNGKVKVMGELLSVSPESVQETRARKETGLHLIVNNKPVIKFMLEEHALRRVVVDVNAHDNCGRTPPDFLGREAVDRDIRGILNAVGAKHGAVRHSSLVLEGESRADICNALLVVAGLIASATYQSMLQPPHFKTEVDKTHTEGFRASYASYMTGFFGRDLAYTVFITGNTFGLLVSL